MIEEANGLYFLVILLSIITLLMLRYVVAIRVYVKELGEAYDKVAGGDYSIQIKTSLYGDIGKAGKSFNVMTKDIKKSVESLNDRNSKLKAILKSISTGIIAVDSDENVMLMNKVAKKIFNFNIKEYEGTPIEKIVLNKTLLQSILNMVHLRERSQTQIEIDSVFYKINVGPIRLDENSKIVIGSIINIEDITERIRLENMRSDFVANVTHELKTPLTSINGFVETLKSDPEITPKNRERFLNIIEIESNRLQRLIDDVLILSFIESNSDYYETHMVDIIEPINQSIELVEDYAQSKNITIQKDIVHEELMVNANSDLLKQLVLNLIDNAINYSNDGGMIRITVTDSKHEVKLTVKDDGIGIPQEDIPRIFERFYRVDKARSKKAGGTGLGLAIVKHIVLKLKASIKVNSELDKGTEFIITLLK